jgi:hypothetical protein
MPREYQVPHCDAKGTSSGEGPGTVHLREVRHNSRQRRVETRECWGESRESGVRPRVKNDPRLVAAARELRDRWLEHVNADRSILLSEAKYDVSRRIERREAEPERRLLAG